MTPARLALVTVLLSGLPICVLSLSAQASVTVYTDFAAYAAAVGGRHDYIVDFLHHRDGGGLPGSVTDARMHAASGFTMAQQRPGGPLRDPGKCLLSPGAVIVSSET